MVFKEPKTKWANSKARDLLLKYLREKAIPLDAKAVDANGKRITTKMIYEMVKEMDGENKKYDPDKFGNRLGSLRKKVREEKEPKFEEPSIKWENSDAKQLVIRYLREGLLPMDPKATDTNGSPITADMVWKMACELDTDNILTLYDRKRFPSRLYSLRGQIANKESRAKADQEHFEEYVRLHPIVSVSAVHGSEYWKGSLARRQLLRDLTNNLLDKMTPGELFYLRPVYYENYLPGPFKDYIKQELRTAKFRKTIREKGKNFQKRTKAVSSK